MSLLETRAGLDALLRPRSVCVLGVSARRPTRGNMVIRNLQQQGFAGRILPVHPQAAALEGLPALRAIEDLPPGVDVAFVALPAADVAGTCERLDRAGVRSAVVITAGFSAAEEAALRDVTGRIRMLVHGPNCMGVLNLSDGVPLYSAATPPKLRPGGVALLAQSGSAAIAVMNTMDTGFSKVVTVGSEFRLTAADYLDWLADDPDTAVVGVVLEAIQAPAAFAAAVRRVRAAGKAVAVLKVGRSAVGSVAAQAHTGALLTPATVYECFFRRLGVPSLADYDQLAAALTTLLAYRAPPAGAAIAVTGISGGETALMCDLVAEAGLSLAAWSADTAAQVRTALPGTTGANPLDVWASVGQEQTDGHVRALQAIAGDPAVGIIVAVQDLQASLPPSLAARYHHPMGAVAAVRRGTRKPVVAVSPTPDPLHPDLASGLAAAGVPVLRGFWAGLGALRCLATPPASEAAAAPGLAPEALAALKADIGAHAGSLPGVLCQRILASYGIGFVRSVLTGPDGALPPGIALDFPVVVKVASAGIAHRSDIGGVRLGITGPGGVREAMAAILRDVSAAAPHAVIDGFEIQEQMTGCVEALAGFSVAPPFGALTVVGSGGVLAELQADRAAELGSVAPAAAAAMIAGTRLGRVLGGYRNLMPPTPLDGLAALVSNLSRLACDLGDVIAECDLNPVLIRPGSGAVKAADVLMVAPPLRSGGGGPG
jgi:acetyltransferase